MGLKEKAEAKQFEDIDPRLAHLRSVKEYYRSFLKKESSSESKSFNTLLNSGFLDILEELIKMNPTCEIEDPESMGTFTVRGYGFTVLPKLTMSYRKLDGTTNGFTLSEQRRGSGFVVHEDFDLERTNKITRYDLNVRIKAVDMNKEHLEDVIVDFLDKDDFFGKRGHDTQE